MTLETLVVVLAGGEGTRLKPLTEHRAKPAVPIGGKYRLIDIPLSNAFNSKLTNILILTQGADDSLIKHVSNIWTSDPRRRSFVEVRSPQILGETYKGDADAVRQVLRNIKFHNPKNVLIVPGDHLLKMDYHKFVDFMEQKNGDFAISIISQPMEQAKQLGSIKIDDSSRIIEFKEKDRDTPFRAKKKDEFYASMGIYAAKTEKLIEALQKEGALFGKHIIPSVLGSMNVVGYDYTENNYIPEIPRINKDGIMIRGDRTKSADSTYWRDVGTISEYFEANMDLVSITPRFSIYNTEWRFFTDNTYFGPGKQVAGPETALISEGSTLTSVGGRDIVISPNVFIEHSDLNQVIVFNDSDIHKCRIKRTIVDKNAILVGMEIGYNASRDERNGIFIDPDSGIRVVRKFYNSLAKKD